MEMMKERTVVVGPDRQPVLVLVQLRKLGTPTLRMLVGTLLDTSSVALGLEIAFNDLSYSMLILFGTRALPASTIDFCSAWTRLAWLFLFPTSAAFQSC